MATGNWNPYGQFAGNINPALGPGGATPQLLPDVQSWFGNGPSLNQRLAMNRANGSANFGGNAWDDPAQMAAVQGQNLTMGAPQINGGTTGGQNWGYGNAPGGSMGYYEQQTPAGSFAAANTVQAFNPYIGQTSQGIQGVGPVGAGVAANPYLGQSSGQASAASNPYAGANNPYTSQAIDAASQDAIRNYQTFTAPARDAAMMRSGSFGNTGQQQMQLEDQRNLQGTLGNIANQARMQDLFRQQDMGEAAANRQTGVSQFNVGANAGDLNRNLLGSFTGQGMGLDAAKFNAGMGLDTQKFNAGLGAADLNRNASLAQSMGMFNAGQQNDTNRFNTSAANQMLGQERSLDQQMNMFDQNMDFNVWNANANNMRMGTRDQMDFLNQMMGWQNMGVGSANQQAQNPYQQWLQMMNGAVAAGGRGGTQSNPYDSDPLLGGLSGWALFQRMFGG